MNGIVAKSDYIRKEMLSPMEKYLEICEEGG